MTMASATEMFSVMNRSSSHGGSVRARVQIAEVNGRPGALFFDADDRLINVFAFEMAGGAIQTVRSIINPDKLAHLGYPLSDLGRQGA